MDGGHPAPFPEELIKRLIKFYSYRGNVVLDPFGGTGTVAAVARRFDRHFVHIDVSRKYCGVAVERVASEACPLFDSSQSAGDGTSPAQGARKSPKLDAKDPQK